MSIFSWFFKPKKKMAQKGTKRVKMGKYTVSSHAQNRIADPKRSLKKSDMVFNLFGKSAESKPYKRNGEMQYDRIHPKTKSVTHITMDDTVKTIHRVHNPQKEIDKWRRK